MKKQLHKIKIAAENFSRPTKADKNSEELVTADKQVERFKDVLEKISKKFSQNAIGGEQDHAAIEKRSKKVHEYRLAQAIDESIKDLPDGLLRNVLDNCAGLEKKIASEIIQTEISIENDVTRKLNYLLDNHIATIQKQKRTVNKLIQDNESAKHKYQAAYRINENPAKISQLKEEQEECETKLDKERDIWAAEMFELIAEEENMSNYIIDYIKYQQSYYKSALKEIEDVMENVNGLIKGNNKKIFRVPLAEHLSATNRSISFVIELCVCCLLEKGMHEEGLLRVGCAGTKLRRLRSAIDAKLVGPPFPSEYHDVHVIASVLKSYLRDLPDPLLTHRLYNVFATATQCSTEEKRKNAILNAINQLPEGNYFNLRYLTKFLSLLAQKQQFNKMSSQNIAIVMSPNLLWPPDTIETDYVQKVNSSAVVNSIVEVLVSDWSFFFSGDINFYVTMSRDQLFPDNGGFPPYERDSTENLMSKSIHVMMGGNNNGGSLAGSVSYIHNANNNNDLPSSATYHTHSRSSSHDASHILLDNTVRRSYSNSSMSDNSSPPQSSPKLPVRRKHNKQTAPTPPDVKSSGIITTTTAAIAVKNVLLSDQQQQNFSTFKSKPSKILYDTGSSTIVPTTTGTVTSNRDDDMNNLNYNISNQQKQHIELFATKSHNSSQTPSNKQQEQHTGFHALKRVNSIENLSKPEKPPRPSFPPIECQTLNRNAFKSKLNEKLSVKPVAMPRTFINVTRSTENLTDNNNNRQQQHRSNATAADNDDDDELDELNAVSLREKTINEQIGINDRPDKPAIPERPISLMRPQSLKGAEPIQNCNNDHGGSSGSINLIKKNNSFRSTIPPASSSNPTNLHPNLKSINNNSTGDITTLERTHIYNVDKKQVSIIDVVDNNINNHISNISNNNNNNNNSNNNNNNNRINETDGDINKLQQNSTIEQMATGGVTSTTTTTTTSTKSVTTIQPLVTTIVDVNHSINTVPPSPRCFDPKIKRPQIPAPPPPTNRPKSDGSASDSTNL